MFQRSLRDNSELRQLEKGHAPELFALTDCCRSYLREWLPWVDGTKEVKDTAAFIESAAQQFASNNGFQTGIWFRGKIAGCIGYHYVDWPNRKTSIGYWLGEEFQGRGLMTMACRALTDHALADLKLNRIEIGIATQNEKSRAIPQRLGFKEEGIRRQVEWLYDHFVDHMVYVMLADDWRKTRSGKHSADF